MKPPDDTVAFGTGFLIGTDKGEWGGELVFRDSSGRDYVLLRENVRRIFGSDNQAVVFTGLAHMGRYVAAVYVVRRLETSMGVGVSKLYDLQGVPHQIKQLGEGSFMYQIRRKDHDDSPGMHATIWRCFEIAALQTPIQVNCNLSEEQP